MSSPSSTLLAVLLFTLFQVTSANQQRCESFTLPSIPEGINTTLTSSKYYPAGALFNESDPNTSLNTTSFTDFCRVQINVTTFNASLAKSEVWLPDDWNQRFLGFGNGASGGGFAWSEMGFGGINYGFAAHATNGGHSSNGSSAAWALGNPEVLVDWHWRAMHQGTVAAKAIIASYYNNTDFPSYYGSCSAGGRQGWMEAERFPDDYDAIIVGSPAIDDIRQSADALWVNQRVLPVNGSTWFSNDTWGLVHAEVLRQCDELDGVKDGVLSDPSVCEFRPQALACRAGANDTSSCLTFDQLNVLRYLYEPWVDANDSYVYAGFPVGGELGFIGGNILLDGGQYSQDGDFIRNTVVNDSSWTVDKIDFATVQLGVTTSGLQDSAINPDISPFVKRGGKLIQYVGYNDQYLSAYESIRWHDTVDTYMSTHTNYTTSDFFRLFVVPGMKHCAGGAGPNVFGQPSSYSTTPPISTDPKYNALYALIDWHEKGNAPSEFIGTSFHNNTPKLGISYQRPICQYPKKAIYDGHGDSNDAASFYCGMSRKLKVRGQ